VEHFCFVWTILRGASTKGYERIGVEPFALEAPYFFGFLHPTQPHLFTEPPSIGAVHSFFWPKKFLISKKFKTAHGSPKHKIFEEQESPLLSVLSTTYQLPNSPPLQAARAAITTPCPPVCAPPLLLLLLLQKSKVFAIRHFKFRQMPHPKPR
jgi:hypothetical protein